MILSTTRKYIVLIICEKKVRLFGLFVLNA